MAQEPLRRTPPRQPAPPGERPKIWAEGSQRPPFDWRAFGRASLHLTRDSVASLHAWAARRTRRAAVSVKNGVGRIPADRLGRMARFVPSHLRVAGWTKTCAAVLAHASATADPDVARGNALVAEIEPHLWDAPATPAAPGPSVPAGAEPPPGAPEPVVLAEPAAPGDDPLAAIRDELAEQPAQGLRRRRVQTRPEGPTQPPPPPGPVATTAIQVSGFLLGWASGAAALPVGLGRALWLYAKGVDLRGIGHDD